MLVSIRVFSNQSVFASGDYGYVRHFNGTQWSLYQLDTPSPLLAIDGVAENDMWVTGSGGFLARFNGSQWTQVSSPTTGDISDLHVISSTEIYGSTRQGDLVFFDGDDWHLVHTPSLAEFNSVFKSPDDIIWLAGNNGAVMSFGESSGCLNNGDVNGDGLVTAADAQMAFYIAIGLVVPTFDEECAADCNGDGIVTAADAQAIFMAVLGQGTCANTLLTR